MTTALFTHDDCDAHVTPQGHPEQVARLQRVRARLAAPEFAALDRRDCPLGADAQIALCHPQAFIDRIVAAEPASGTVALDADTHMSPGSVAAARRAVGGAVAAVDAVMTGAVRNAFVAVRPPGHHAETAKVMGFCLFGTVAIAAKHAMAAHGLRRVAVVDFDVHHGNGTQDLLWDERRALVFSSHQYPHWPGTGAPEDRGAHGQVHNIPLPPGSGGPEMRAAYVARVFPVLEAFAPDLILVSAGFDAHIADPLAELRWQTGDYAWLTREICALAARHCGGRVVSVLEGGYDLDALADSAAAHVTTLMAG